LRHKDCDLLCGGAEAVGGGGAHIVAGRKVGRGLIALRIEPRVSRIAIPRMQPRKTVISLLAPDAVLARYWTPGNLKADAMFR
jgi:hypothetical protein